MSIYAVADLHLSFCPDIDKPMDVFGPGWADHENRLKRSWLSTVEKDDTVVIIGDISWGIKLDEAGYDLDWIHELPGKKIMIKGNHDLWWNGIKRLNTMYDDIFFLQNDTVTAEGCCICGSRGWLTPDQEDYRIEDEKIYRRELIRLEMSLKAGRKAMDEGDEAGEMIGMLHYPPVNDVRAGSGFHELFKDYGIKRVYYGHLHGEEAFRTALIGDYDGINYNLVSLDHMKCSLMKIK